jgi:hypothetical protein
VIIRGNTFDSCNVERIHAADSAASISIRTNRLGWKVAPFRGIADILIEGEFRQTGPLRAELDETHLADLPRLAFHFNRRDLGRLRQLIDCINRGTVERY